MFCIGTHGDGSPEGGAVYVPDLWEGDDREEPVEKPHDDASKGTEVCNL